MKVKRITSILITFVIVFSILNNITASALALYDSENYPDYSYDIKTSIDNKYDYFYLKNGTIVLRKIKDTNKICEIPNLLNGNKVKYVDLVCFVFKKITSIYIPENLDGFYTYSDNYFFDRMPNEDAPFDEAINIFSECGKLKSIKVDDKNKSFTSYNNILYNKKKTELIAYPRNKNLKTFKISNGVKYISSRAFYKSKLKNISISKNIKIIGSDSFMQSKNLKCFELKGNVKEIESFAFCNCQSLSKFKMKFAIRAPEIQWNAFKNTKKGIKFVVKNKRVAKSLKKKLKGTGVKNAKILIGKKVIYQNING